MRERYPTQITVWRWCRFRDKNDNKKEDFKVTSRSYRRANNSRNASVVVYKEAQQEVELEYAEVQFFFHACLPSELRSVQDTSRHVDRGSDSEEEERAREAVHYMALVRKILVVVDGLLVKKGNGAGALAVISANSIEGLIGTLKVGKDEYLTGRFTSMLG
jgi:hypothetical protein